MYLLYTNRFQDIFNLLFQIKFVVLRIIILGFLLKTAGKRKVESRK